MVLERGMAVRQAATDLGSARERAAQVGEGREGNTARRRFRGRAGCGPMMRRWRGCGASWQDEGRARHPKKSHRLLREGTTVKFEFIAKHRGAWRTRDVRGARCLAGRVLRVAAPAAKPSQSREPATAGAGSHELRAERSDLRQSAGLARFACLGHRCGRASGCSADASGRLAGASRRRRLPFDTGRAATSAIAPNLLDRQFEATAPNQRWVADFTYIWTARRLAVLRGRARPVLAAVVGWSMSSAHDRATRHRCADHGDLASRSTEALLHHSDQGSQYTSEHVPAAARANTASPAA